MQKASRSMKPRIHWSPSGVFTFVPIHAAGIYDGSHQECCSDYVVSSYTPTVAALHRAQQSTRHFTHSDLNILAVAADSTEDKTLPRLRYVEEEICNIIEISENNNIDLEVRCLDSAAVSTVSESIQSANFIHIASHGIQDNDKPLNSAFCLADGRLTVTELMKLNLKKAFFAFLAACETAKGDEEQPDQTIHLAASMLFAGFKSIVATMW
jgi:CHAT domain-containing protein